MNHTGGVIFTATIWALAVGLAVWAITIPLRRTFAGQLASPVLIGTFASLGAVIGAQHSMLYASGDFRVAVIVAVAAGLISAATAFSGAHSLARDKKIVVQAMQAIGEGRKPEAGGRRLRTELESLRLQVDEAAGRLHTAGERERALEASRRELVAWVSHDLRTPLAGLRAMAEALEDGMVDAPERYYKQIRVDVETLTGMVDDLFELARIQAGVLRPGADRIDVGDVVSDCLASLEPLARVQDVTLTGEAAPGLVVSGDSRELNRAVTNVVANAVRHTRPAGSVCVRVRAANGTDGGGEAAVEVLVRDECGGISPDVIARIFDVGYRGEQARSPEPEVLGGAGLGLAITRGILVAHGGTVRADNVDGGCEFTLRLPAAR